MELKQKLRNPLLINIASIGLVQIANYAIPIVIIPIVVNALQAEAFGTASYAQNIVAYLTLIVNFGFEYSATQEIAINKENHTKLKEIFWRVITAKTVLFIATLAILSILYVFMPRVHEDPMSFFCAGLINLGFALFPTWFFQGMEKMAKMSLFNFGIKSIGAIFTILLVKAPEDYRLYLLSLSIAQVAVGFASLFYVQKVYALNYTPAQNIFTSPEVKKGLPIFINTFFVNCNLFVGVTIMGFYMNDDTHIGIYTGAQRIIMAILMIASQPITISLFPRISRKFQESQTAGLSYLKQSLLYVSLFSIVVSVVTYVAAPIMVKILLGEAFNASTDLLRYMAVLPFLVTLDSTITIQGLYGMQLEKYAPMVGFTTCMCNIALNLYFVPRMGETGIVLVWVICQVIDISLATALISWKKKR